MPPSVTPTNEAGRMRHPCPTQFAPPRVVDGSPASRRVQLGRRRRPVCDAEAAPFPRMGLVPASGHSALRTRALMLACGLAALRRMAIRRSCRGDTALRLQGWAAPRSDGCVSLSTCAVPARVGRRHTREVRVRVLSVCYGIAQNSARRPSDPSGRLLRSAVRLGAVLSSVWSLHVFEPPCTNLLVAEEDVPLGSHKSRPGLRKRRRVVRVWVLQDCAAVPVELLGEVPHLSIERDRHELSSLD